MACDLRHLLALLQKEASPEDDKDWGANVNSLHEETVSDVRPALLMMRRRGLRSFSSHAGTCPTSSSSAPSRAAKEIDLRSVGASRARIIQQLLGESIIFSLCRGALGLRAAHFGVQLLIKFLPTNCRASATSASTAARGNLLLFGSERRALAVQYQEGCCPSDLIGEKLVVTSN
jgi:hypothetical protein